MGAPRGGVYGTSGVRRHSAHFSLCSHFTAYTPPGARGRIEGMSLYLPSSAVGSPDMARARCFGDGRAGRRTTLGSPGSGAVERSEGLIRGGRGTRVPGTTRAPTSVRASLTDRGLRSPSLRACYRKDDAQTRDLHFCQVAEGRSDPGDQRRVISRKFFFHQKRFSRKARHSSHARTTRAQRRAPTETGPH